MMYKNSLAMAVKVNGKVLREHKDSVFLPFGSEYSLLLKNLNSVRTIVNITIDGQNMTRDGLVINAYSELELERMLKDNLNEGNRFKFIERSDAVEQHRGVKLEDGLIRVEYQFEKVYQHPLYYVSPNYFAGNAVFGSSTAGSITRSAVSVNNVSTSATSTFTGHPGVACNFVEQGFNDSGITVPGSVSNQKFTTVASFPLEAEKHVMIFKLLGETPDNEPIRKPVTVKHKPKCITCGKQNKATAKFCSTCGTALTVIA